MRKGVEDKINCFCLIVSENICHENGAKLAVITVPKMVLNEIFRKSLLLKFSEYLYLQYGSYEIFQYRLLRMCRNCYYLENLKWLKLFLERKITKKTFKMFYLFFV